MNSDKQDARGISYISFLLSNVYIILQKCVRHTANGCTVWNTTLAVDSRTRKRVKRTSLNLKAEFHLKQTSLSLQRKTTWRLEDQQSEWRKSLLTVVDMNGYRLSKNYFLANTTIFHVPLLDWRYWMLDVSKVYASGSNAWDTAVHDASEEYKHRMVNGSSCGCLCIISLVEKGSHHLLSSLSFSSQHNLCCDNCHSHVAMALNLMRYENSTSWNMVKLCLLALIHGKHVR